MSTDKIRIKIGEYDAEAISNTAVKVGCQIVTQREIDTLQWLMANWKPVPQFKVGDFVRVRADAVPNPDLESRAVLNLRGKAGKVVRELQRAGSYVGVEFPERFLSGSDLIGLTAPGHGYNLLPEMLEPID